MELFKEQSRLGFKIEATVTEDVTHYVARECEEERVVESGSLNYYLALVSGKWIVSFKCELQYSAVSLCSSLETLFTHYLQGFRTP